MGWSITIFLSLICIWITQSCRTTKDDRGGENRAVLDTPCVFPFEYKFVNYTSCTDRNDPDGFLWCSTQVDKRGKHVRGKFGYCSPGCPGVEDDLEDEDAEVNTAEESDISLRSSSIYGRFCFSSSGFTGSCRKSDYCVDTDYSYSRKCGWDYVCCKKSPNRNSKLSRTPATSRPIWNSASTPSPPPSPPPPPRPATLCGIQGTQPFVFGGKKALPGQFPFMVSFVYTDLSKLENFCGGVMITNIHVLTAGHCFYLKDPSQWKSGLIDVRIGLDNIQGREKARNQANIERVVIHPQYREIEGGKEGVRNDIAIVTLSRHVDTPWVCLPELQRNKDQKAVVIGFGKTERTRGFGGQQDELRFAYLDEYGTRDCQNKYDNFYRRSRHKPVITSNMLCAGNTESDACSGDSGGPLLYLNSALRWMVGGVVSFGPSTCGNRAPGVYTNVKKYIPWIKRETGL